MPHFNRRQFILAGAPFALSLTGIPEIRAFADTSPLVDRFGEPHPFDFGLLQQTAKNLAAKSYVAPKSPAADVVSKIDFDTAQKIKFRPGWELFGDGPAPFPVRLFHVDKFI